MTRCESCGQSVPRVQLCICGHTRVEHSIRERRRGVLVRVKCFVENCPCEKYQEEK